MLVSRARRAFLLCTLLLLIRPAAFAAAGGVVRYDVTPADPAQHRFRVSITVQNEGAGPVLFAIPAWTPGYYQILSFQKDISNFRAANAEGHTLEVTRPDERTWEVASAGGSVTATYEVNAQDAGFGFFGSHLDEHTGYINGASALMYVVGGKILPATITYHLPAGWKLASPLDSDGEDTFKAADYDELIDGPTQMGELERLDFNVKGTPFAAILVGQSPVDRPALVDLLTKISAQAIDLFGYAPFKRYVYFFHFAVGNFGGGLEHRSSTVLNIFRTGKDPHVLTPLVAHEYFHVWNVKRLHPAVLGPFDYTQKVRTGALWFAEGVTDYYSVVLPLRAGLLSEQGFREDMAGRIRQLERTGARKTVSAEEASRKAWEGGSMGFGGLSYYLKGSLLGLLFDVKIRAATDNAKSLDDVMRLLDERYGKQNRGYEEDAILRAINDVSGRDFTDLYDRYVRGTDEIPWNDILREAGLAYEAGSEKISFIGVATHPGTRGSVVVDTVVPDSPAAAAGLREGDEIAALNQTHVTTANWESSVHQLSAGRQITLGIRRGGAPMELPLTVGSKDSPYVRIVPLPDADAPARRVREGLLHMKESRDGAA